MALAWSLGVILSGTVIFTCQKRHFVLAERPKTGVMADDDDPATTVGAESKWRVVRALAHVFRKIDDVVATIGRPLRSFGKESPLREVPHFNPFIYSFEAFIPLLKFDQTANWTLQRDAKGLLWFYWYVHILSGWVLTSLWIGAYAGIMKT